MDSALVLIILMYVLSALLPLLGLWGLYRTATRDAREYSAATYGGPGQPNDEPDMPTIDQSAVLLQIAHRATEGRPQAAVADFVYIGLGVFLGAAASIWTLLLPA
ncbi:hypothetical protein [Mycetocola zhujimingii]|uniref:hypothetical protein n=1 Tax=Mycetocola zhujimingii TaxID=2079792 RepID=UPI000D3D5249|nr:hypothetical protein [Mycetocola zhujimingii]AWB85501.1 hypothetical protein C3E77_01885 [Mycetocola zhujimingii]